ncbi:MAG TPA: glycoside hydrolase family 3 C-terminal domain-containing protein [Candidatus Saccharibacteria bacterium]|nr:glycoside hydrolase family 3 C-terminal domain-containing protein [Candidatus Saccharibacteria bacterium]
MKTASGPRKHQDIIEQLTLEEKAGLMSGANFWNTKAVERLGVPSIMLTDGPHGLRKQGGKADHLGLNKSIPATCFPAAATLANSWDTRLLSEVGEALGREAAAEKVSVLLGPGLNIARDPLGGRNFEYYSEDPYISGELAAAMVKGVQSTGVAACPKHFAANSQEHLRMSIDEIVDERTLRELYLEGFRRVVVGAKPRVVMSSYNKVNGVYANENVHLLNDILRKEWGFDGVVVTDWGGNNNRVAGLKAGNQLEMPSSGGVTDAEIVVAVKAGKLDEEVLNERVDTLLDVVFDADKATDASVSADHEAHHTLAVEAARHSVVLLKNDTHALPLSNGEKVAVIGDFAGTPRYQGAGSSLVNPTRLDTPIDALRNTNLEIIGYEPGFKRAGGHSTIKRTKAVRLAKLADTIVLFLGLPEASEAEGSDREHMRLPDNQLRLVNELAGLGKKIVVVLAGGAPVELPFVDGVQAIVHGFLGGQGAGTALASIVTGEYAPSGKLAMSYPLIYDDAPTAGNYPGKERTAEHREGLFVGYRYYDTRDVPVRFPFGHGLSYTIFEYGDLVIEDGKVSCSIKNIGNVAGEEIAQLYLGVSNASYAAPKHELKGFIKVMLQPGEQKHVTFTLDDHTFAYYDVNQGRWRVEEGERIVEIGASSRDIRLSGKLWVTGDKGGKRRNDLPHYGTGDIKNVSTEEFTKMLGRELPPATWGAAAPLTMDDTIRQLSRQNWIGRLCYGLIMGVRKFYFLCGQPIKANNVMFIVDMPFNKIERMSGGRISRQRVEKFVRLTSRQKH